MENRQVVAFRLGDEEYAVEIQAVKEIIRPTDITRIPRAPGYFLGLINLRGIIVPVISLSKRLRDQVREMTDQSRIIILNVDDTHVGITVDNVTEVFTMTRDQLEESRVLDLVDSKFIREVAKIEDRLILLLDLAEVFN
ncbi:MAG: chemotaxis protein CheW [Syntrophomonadaceae bacterium]|nr:chemotaxis protein CheW [Syntrophomonadaceae bacterium]